MTDKLRQAAQQALDALESSQQYVDACANAKAIAGWGEQLDVAEAAITAIREALEEQPAQHEPVADKHQAFIDSLPPDMEDKMFEQIHYWARQSYARHQRSTRGQTITAADSSDSHIIWAALRWAKENTATSQAQVTKLMKERND